MDNHPQAFARPGARTREEERQVEGGAVVKQEQHQQEEEQEEGKEGEAEAGHDEQTTPPRGQDGHQTDRAAAGGEQVSGSLGG